MKIIVCVAKNGGMLFNGRRVSRDSVLCDKVLEITNASRLLMNNYSAKQFADTSKIIIDDDFLNNAADDDFCFVENTAVPAEKIDSIYRFNWNIDYPADFFFEIDPKECGFKKVKTENFEGSSHKKITLEIFERK